MVAGIILPNGNPANGGMYAITFRVQGSKLIDGKPDIITKYYGVMTELPKLEAEEFNALVSSAQQLINADRDFAAHTKDAEDYQVSITIAYLQRLG